MGLSNIFKLQSFSTFSQDTILDEIYILKLPLTVCFHFNSPFKYAISFIEQQVINFILNLPKVTLPSSEIDITSNDRQGMVMVQYVFIVHRHEAANVCEDDKLVGDSEQVERDLTR